MTEKFAIPFTYQATKSGKVMVYRGRQQAITLHGQKAAAFLAEISDTDEESAQLLMARVTGQFKFGNERSGKQAMRRKGLY